MKLLLSLLAASLLFLPAVASAQVVGPVLNHCIVDWDASPSADVATYKVFMGVTATDPGTQVATVTAPALTWTCPIGQIADGQKYVYVVAVDAAGNEALKSNVFPFVLDRTAPAPAGNVRVR
jgi:hypothetical protein